MCDVATTVSCAAAANGLRAVGVSGFVNGMYSEKSLKHNFLVLETLKFGLSRSWKVLEISDSMSVRTLVCAIAEGRSGSAHIAHDKGTACDALH